MPFKQPTLNAASVQQRMHPIDDAQLREFCHQYLFRHGCNATGAYLAIQPDVTRASASVLGSRLLKKVRTQAILAEIAREAMKRNKLDQDLILGMWSGMAVANVLDYFEEDPKGNLVITKIKQLSAEIQRNIAALEITSDQLEDKVVRQRIKLKIVDRKGVIDSMAKAAGMFGDFETDEERGDTASAIEEGFERVRKAQSAQA